MSDSAELFSIQGETNRSLMEIQRSLCLSTKIESVSDASLRATFEAGLAWIKQFIMQPHPALGRKGPVCPFAQPAHEAGAIYFCALDVGEMNFDVFIDVMMQLRSFFGRLAGSMHRQAEMVSLCMFPINLRPESYYKFIDCAHSILKPFYMNAGWMLGEFHPLSAVRGAHSEKIFPMRSDVPIFVIRAISPHDILFIDRQSGALGVRIHELECYLRGVGSRLPPGEVARLNDRIEELKSQLLGNEDVSAWRPFPAKASGLLDCPFAGTPSSVLNAQGVAPHTNDKLPQSRAE